MVELKEYMTIEVWTLIVAIATFIVSCLAYIYNRKSDKKRIKSLIARKEAQLKAIEFASSHTEYTVSQHYMVQKAALNAEIEELKEML